MMNDDSNLGSRVIRDQWRKRHPDKQREWRDKCIRIAGRERLVDASLADRWGYLGLDALQEDQQFCAIAWKFDQATIEWSRYRDVQRTPELYERIMQRFFHGNVGGEPPAYEPPIEVQHAAAERERTMFEPEPFE